MDLDEIFRDLELDYLSTPLSFRKAQEKVQLESDWPVSPGHALV